MIRLQQFNYWINGLPNGCRLCVEGDKTIIFVTGSCYDKCFYCPISYARRRPEAFYVDEEPVNDIDDIIRYIEIVGGRGASLTGGDPLIKLDKTIEIIRRLKSEFGHDFHIHLYTSGRLADLGALKMLDKAGLDEIRFHPVDLRYLDKIKNAVRETSMNVGVEIPVIPDYDDYIKKIILFLEEIEASFINLNELEVSETNKEAIMFRGYKISDDGVSVVGSRETAMRIIRWAKENNIKIMIHYCSAKLKDLVQTLRRMRRIAFRIKAGFQKVSEEGLLTWVEILSGERSLEIERLLDGYEYLYYNNRYYVHPDILENKDLVNMLRERFKIRFIERSPVVLGGVSRENIIENTYDL
jgi:pyruvate formate-lyase activating enzyme-like uncharacterized protein